jgi:dTDP-4-amino-4,6-dideoxygalactose transaminase
VEWKVPLSDVQFTEDEFSAVQVVLKSGWLTMGEVTQEFEKEFCQFTGAKYAFAVTNATAALHLACQSIGLVPGDEVILPSLTFVATANAIRYTGATPVFVDINGEQDLTISVDAIEQAITSRTRAIMVMHYGGYACEMPGIMSLSEKYHLKVIEDAAHATGSFLANRHLGTFGDSGCFSFFSNKNMTTGEGGMLITDEDSIADQVKVMRSHGMTSLTWDRHKGHSWSYDVVGLGYNYRIDEIRSALGRVQLSKLEGFNQQRRELTDLYRELIAELAPSIIVPFQNHSGRSACHLMPVLLPVNSDRIRFMEWMKSKGIQTSIHYPPIHTFSAFKKEKKFDWKLSKTEQIGGREVTLPLYPTLTKDQVKWVVEAIRDFLLENENFSNS